MIRKISQLALALCLTWILGQGPSLAQGNTSTVVGVLPFHVNYPNDMNWLGVFLQEELTHQLVLSRIATLPAPTFQLWQEHLPLDSNTLIDARLLNQLHVRYLIRVEVQKVLSHASIHGFVFFNDTELGFQALPFQSADSWKTPDDAMGVVLKSLAKRHNHLARLQLQRQNYTWEGVEALYRWKLQPKQIPGTPEWQNYKEELEALRANYPEMGQLIYTALASLLIQEGVYPAPKASVLKQAEEVIQEALTRYPQYDHAHALLAQIYYYQDNKNAAKAEAVVANGYNPWNTIAKMIYGFTIGRTLKEGEPHILRGLDDNPFLQDPSYFAQRNLPAYEALAITMQELRPALTSVSQYETLMREGHEFYKQTEWDQAQQRFEQASQLDPKQLDPHIQLARIELAKKRYLGAIERLTDLESKFPDSEPVYYHLGLANERLKDFDQAEQYYRKVLFLSAQHPQSLLRLGTVLMKLKRYDEASSFLESLTRYYPKSATAWWTRGMLHWVQKDWSQARTMWEEALRFDPNNPKIQKALQQLDQRNNNLPPSPSPSPN